MSYDEGVIEQLRQLRENYAQQLPGKIAALETAAKECSDRAGVAALRSLAHGLAGSGSTFGFPEVSETARRLEVLVQTVLDEGRRLSAAEAEIIAGYLDALQRAGHKPIPWSAPAMAPKRASSTSATKLVYLVEDDALLANDLALQLVHYGYEIKTFDAPDRFREALTVGVPKAIIMDIVFPEGDLAGVEMATKIAREGYMDVPILFVSVRDDLTARLAAVHAGASGYCLKPLDIPALAATLDDLTAAPSGQPDRVLIVEDTRVLAEHYACTLELAGITARVLTEPMQILAEMNDFRPNLVLMDMYMPGCSGAELAAAIRQLENYNMVPIVFLSTESDTRKQMKAITLGGDDFLVKPIAPDYLVSAVTARLRRYRTLRASVQRDSLTGLLNHAATKDYLARETARAARHAQPFCLAIIDLDHFKAVNDNHGHLAGDRVLKQLADQLKHRLRKSDIVGRVGGEEFAVIVPQTGEPQAKILLEDLCKGFAHTTHRAEAGEFSVTFSCGVAEYRIGESDESLYIRADQALYQAKQAGRNRVVTAR